MPNIYVQMAKNENKLGKINQYWEKVKKENLMKNERLIGFKYIIYLHKHSLISPSLIQYIGG